MNTIPNQKSKLLAGKPPIGLSDFPRLIREGYAYVDKSLLIQSMLDSPTQVLLLPRTRRFGKTLNLSMLRAFFEHDKPENTEIFRGLAIERAGEEYMAHRGRYPVVFLTLKDVKTLNWDDCLGHLQETIAIEYLRHRDALTGEILMGRERTLFDGICDGTVTSQSAYENSLKNLLTWLERAHGEKGLFRF